MHIAFIGGGHMSTSLVGGLRARGVPAGHLCVADPLPAQLERLQFDFGVRVTTDNADAVRDADVVVLAVKPQQMADAARSIAGELAARRRVVVSVAAGIRLADLARWLGTGTPVVRSMPNRPALIGAGITAACAGPGVGHEDRAAVEGVLSAVGALRIHVLPSPAKSSGVSLARSASVLLRCLRTPCGPSVRVMAG